MGGSNQKSILPVAGSWTGTWNMLKRMSWRVSYVKFIGCMSHGVDMTGSGVIIFRDILEIKDIFARPKAHPTHVLFRLNL